jgi:hypothetical protein
MELWIARTEALDYLHGRHPSRLAVIKQTFELFDAAIDAFQSAPDATPYAATCAVALLKAKNLAHGAFSLILDGLGQEAGALLRPMIEYAELLTYFRLHSQMVERALTGNLPSAGERAKSIAGIYKNFREYLNENASHSSFSDASVAHLIDSNLMSLRKRQHMVPHVLDQNLLDLAVHLQLLLREALLSLESTGSPAFPQLGDRWERLKARMFDVFDLNAARRQGGNADA